jgi:hypothetical protein
VRGLSLLLLLSGSSSQSDHLLLLPEENAVDLTINFMGLQNNYEFEAFEQKVLEALTALVACCPRKVAP